MVKAIKRIREKQKQRLADLQGVLLKLIEQSETDEERAYYETLIEQTENKIKEI